MSIHDLYESGVPIGVWKRETGTKDRFVLIPRWLYDLMERETRAKEVIW